MLLTATDAGQIALEFLLAEWNIFEEYRNWFLIVSSRLVGQNWYIVELAVKGFPDRWFIQVYDTGECDPNYTFISPFSGDKEDVDLVGIPHLIAEVLVSERRIR